VLIAPKFSQVHSLGTAKIIKLKLSGLVEEDVELKIKRQYVHLGCQKIVTRICYGQLMALS